MEEGKRKERRERDIKEEKVEEEEKEEEREMRSGANENSNHFCYETILLGKTRLRSHKTFGKDCRKKKSFI